MSETNPFRKLAALQQAQSSSSSQPPSPASAGASYIHELSFLQYTEFSSTPSIPAPHHHVQPPHRSSSTASAASSRPAARPAAKTESLALTPLRAHYLKRELVTLEFIKELAMLDSPSALSLLGPPFLPKSRFLNGVPLPAPPPNSPAALAEAQQDESVVDLPFLRFVFHHFVLSFPFLANCPPTFFSHKLQPLVYSFVNRNISSSDEREEVTARRRIAGKIEKHLGLVLSAAIKVTENEGREEVVRIEEDGSATSAAPASQLSALPSTLPSNRKASPIPGVKKEPEFEINVVSVRNTVVKGRVRTKAHEEFIVRTRRRGNADVYVARRYGDFNRLADTLRKECIEEDVHSPPPKDRRATESRAAGGPTSPTGTSSPSTAALDDDEWDNGSPIPIGQTYDSAHLPTLARERNRLTLRAYLRSLLSNATLAASPAFQSFLLESPIVLTSREMRDVEVREEMDHVREEEARRFQTAVEDRVAELEGYIRGFREELVKNDGLTRVFATIRHTAKVEDLPIEYRKVIEWARISLASTIYQLFLGSDNSSSVFAQLKRLHGLMPYFMLRGILKISNPVAMVRSALDLFLARPFGSTSLLQKMFSSGLAEEAKELREDAGLVARKIAHEGMVTKVEKFVDAPREMQDTFRADALEENLDIMSVILRSPLEPALDRGTMQRVQRASVAYEEYKVYRAELSDPEDDEGPDNDDAWLYEDLHVLLRVLTKARDKEQLVELIFEGSTSEVLKDIVTIFYEPLAKVYKAANIADSLGDLQTFLNDLIKTVELAEEANLAEPQRTVQIFVDLVARHEARFYHFVHQVHSKGEGLFDNLMTWIELFINFVRDGLPSPISLDYLLPHAGVARSDVIAEIDAVVDYHRKLKAAHHERMRRRMLRGEQSAKDADTAFVTGVMDNLHIGAVMGDVADVTAEDSEDDEQEYGASSSEDDEPEEAVGFRPGPSTTPARQGSGGPLLERIPDKKGGKKDRVPINPPKLKLIPELVPVFVELVRGELNAARKGAKVTKPGSLG